MPIANSPRGRRVGVSALTGPGTVSPRGPASTPVGETPPHVSQTEMVSGPCTA